MSAFVPIVAGFSVLNRPIGLDDVDAAAQAGIQVIVCNRPDGEAPDQVSAEAVAAACARHGIRFAMAPMAGGMLSPEVLAAMDAALPADQTPCLAYCRSGTRSTHLWALVTAGRRDLAPDAIQAAAGRAGYDLTALVPLLDRMAERGL